MAWFNTDWNIANMFNLPTVGGSTNNPYGFTGGQAGGNMIVPWTNTVTGQTWDAPNTGYQPPNSNWQMTGGNKTNNLGAQNSVWGAPAYYQASNNNMFNNPYQTQGGGFFNPYQFGQVNYPSQYNTNQQPWWMNYNTNSSIVNPPNIPTTSVDPMDQGKYVGNPNHANDGWAGGTQKGHTAYATAEDAMAADDYWSAYRKDHQQWRDSQGIYASGGGKEDGQSDLHYPGNPDLGIRSDAHQLKAMGMGGMFESQLPTAEQKKLLSMFSSTPNAEGGNDYKVIGDGTVVLPSGLTVETQLTDPYKNNPNIFDNENELRASNDILSSGDLWRYQDLKNNGPFVLDNSNSTIKETDIPPWGQAGLNTNSVFPYVPSDDGPFNYPSTLDISYPYVPSDDYDGPNIFMPPESTENWADEINKNLNKQKEDTSFYEWQRNLADKAKGSLSSLGSNIFDLIIPKAEGAVINDGNMLQNWVEKGPGMQGASQDEVASWMETGDAVQEYARKGNLMRNMLTDNYNSTPLGANVSAMIEANKIAAVKKEKDEGTFTPRVTAPAKKAAAEKKVVKKATPKRVTVNYNKNKPVAVKSKPTRTPAPKVTRTTGSRGGRGNVAKKKAEKKYTSRGGW